MPALNDIKMKPKLITLFLLAGIIPVMVVGWWANQKATSAIMQSSFNQLEAIRGIKKSQVEGFFSERLGDVRVLADNPFVVQAMKDLDAAFDAGGGFAGGKFKGHTGERYDAPDEFREVHDKYFENSVYRFRT